MDQNRRLPRQRARVSWHPGVTNNTFLAKVTVRIKKSVTLPANAVAAIKQTSLLGEKYVETRQATRVPGPTGTSRPVR